MRILVLLALILIGPSVVQPAAAEKRIALVIGNADYTLISRLNNPANDAALMTTTLKAAGFKVITATNLDFRGMRRAVRTFGIALRQAGRDAVGLFYYSGHGVQSRGQNYLLPLKAEIATEYDLDIEAMSASDILGQMKSAGNRLNLLILDACRNNPLATGARSLSKGFAIMKAPSGSLIAFAAAPGQIASDGNGRNSPYTAALAKELLTPGLQVEQVFKRVRVAVEDETSQRQTPWEQSSLRGDFFFVPRNDTLKAQPSPPPAINNEALFWSSVKDSKSPAALKEYLKQFPNGVFSGLAKLRLEAMEPAKEKPKETDVAVGIVPEEKPKVKTSVCSGVEAIVADKKKCLKPGDVFRDCQECPEMVTIPPGTFMMGSPDRYVIGAASDERPRRKVTISNTIAVGKFEVTYAEWDACYAGGGCNGYRPKAYWGRGRQPVTGLSWNDAQAYVNWLGRKTGKNYRLLSEAEWEYAARAGTQTQYSVGEYITTNDANFNGQYPCGNHKGEYRERTVAVGSFAGNAFGLHDLHGNLSEWVQDCYKDSYKGAPTDGTPVLTGSCDLRVMRGGTFSSHACGLRSASRSRGWPLRRLRAGQGLRVARTLSPDS